MAKCLCSSTDRNTNKPVRLTSGQVFIFDKMVTRLKITLEQTEYSALMELAVRELRAPEEQARYILRQVLTRQDLLPKQHIRRPGNPQAKELVSSEVKHVKPA